MFSTSSHVLIKWNSNNNGIRNHAGIRKPSVREHGATDRRVTRSGDRHWTDIQGAKYYLIDRFIIFVHPYNLQNPLIKWFNTQL